MSSKSLARSGLNLLTLLSAWAVVLVMHGAVPYVSTPTLGQAVWSTGFAQSFANQSMLSIFATNFGAPEPAAMAFGLPGAMLTGVFIRLGLPPPDAYSAMVACWMGLAFISARNLAIQLSASLRLAWFAAFTWMSMPIIWAHANYSMLSIGIALLPLYLLQSIRLIHLCGVQNTSNEHAQLLRMWTYPLVCVLAIFMDGYSFMFFASGSSILLASAWLTGTPGNRHRLHWVALPLHATSVLLAYFLYSLFIGKSSYLVPPIDFFRGWGADLSFLIQPTKGMHWFPDMLGWGVERSEEQYFGDESVWVTTFCIPILLVGLWVFWRLPRRHPVALGLICILFSGLYMALGPSIKLNSVKPRGYAGQLMSVEAGLARTGSEVISTKLPGFNTMRASYRWIALAIFGAWGLLVLALTSSNSNTKSIAILLTGIVVLLNVPGIPGKLEKDIRWRNMFFQIEKDLVEDMRSVLSPGEKVAFLPWRNDFLVNYLAARLNIVSYNIGGDKNLESARANWPTWMRGFQPGAVDEKFVDRIVMQLASREADVVVLPYSDMLKAANEWPAPQEFKSQMLSLADALAHHDMLEVIRREHYVAARLSPEFRERSDKISTLRLLKNICLPPLCLERKRFDQTTMTQTGTLNGARLVTQSLSGFLLFGPGVEMAPGEYLLTLRGTSQSLLTAWADVASNQGRTQHAQYALKQQNGAILLETRISLPALVRDLEIRVFATPSDRLQLEGYEMRLLTPASDAPPNKLMTP